MTISNYAIPSSNTANDVVIRSDGVIIVAGSSQNGQSMLSYYYQNSTTAFTTLYFAGSAGTIHLVAVALDSSDNIYCAGYVDTPSQQQDIQVSKVTAGRSVAYTNSYGTVYPDYAYGIAVSGNGTIYITGATQGNLQSQTNNGAVGSTYDYFVSALDTNGNHLWTIERGTVGSDQGNHIYYDGTSKLYVTGVQGQNSFLACINAADGSQVFSVSDLLGSYSGSVLHNGQLYVSGAFKGTVDGTSSNSNSQDLFMTRFNPTTGVRDSWSVLKGTSIDEVGQDMLIVNGTIHVVGFSLQSGTYAPIYFNVPLSGQGGQFEVASDLTSGVAYYGVAAANNNVFMAGSVFSGSGSGVFGVRIATTAAPTPPTSSVSVGLVTSIPSLTQTMLLSSKVTPSALPTTTKPPVFKPSDATAVQPFLGLFIWVFLLVRYLM